MAPRMGDPSRFLFLGKKISQSVNQSNKHAINLFRLFRNLCLFFKCQLLQQPGISIYICMLNFFFIVLFGGLITYLTFFVSGDCRTIITVLWKVKRWIHASVHKPLSQDTLQMLPMEFSHPHLTPAHTTIFTPTSDTCSYHNFHTHI